MYMWQECCKKARPGVLSTAAMYRSAEVVSLAHNRSSRNGFPLPSKLALQRLCRLSLGY